MTPQFLRWLDAPRNDRGLRFLSDCAEWAFVSYQDIAAGAYTIAAQLHDAGLPQNPRVCIVLPTGPELIAAIYATWLSGGTICPVIPPTAFDEEDRYIQNSARLFASADASAIITVPALRKVIDAALFDSRLQHLPVVEPIPAGTTPGFSGTDRASVALLQFTSGSTGAPRGVKITFENLDENINSIRKWIRMGSDDVTATWLPLYHDMGLIGCLLTPVSNCTDVWVMRPDQFIRDPSTWLKCFGQHGANLCAAPNFGYAYAARKVPDSALAGSDFSNWRVAIAGAEPVNAGALRSLANRLEKYGFSRRAFLPAYGLAEATLAVTGRSPDDPEPLAVQLDWEKLRFGQPVRFKASTRIDQLNDESGSWLVSSGAPLQGTHIQVVDSDGRPLLPDTLGEILVNSGSLADGYSDIREESPTRFDEKGLRTGDAGFLHGNELFVVGRIADSLKVRGRTVYAEDLEMRLSTETSIHRGRLVVIAMPGESGGAVLAIAEDADLDWAHTAAKVIKTAVGSTISVRVAVGPRGIILRTSSGKPRRRLLWELSVLGQINFQHTADL